MEILKTHWRVHYIYILLTAFVAGLFINVLTGLQQALAHAEHTVQSSLAVVAFLRDSVSDAEAADLMSSIKTQDPEALTTTYTSKDQALQEAMKDPSLAKSLLLLKNNPLPTSIRIQYSDRAWWERFEPGDKLHGIEAIQEVRWDPQAQALFRSLHRWRLWAMRFSAFVGVIFFVWAMVGLYRFLSLRGQASELFTTLGVGLAGGMLAWGVWCVGLRTAQAEISALQPFWMWLLPMLIGVVTAQGNFGLEARHAE